MHSLLSLFGEQFATQFASQSLTWLDHLLTAMVPLGILTLASGAIRVRGPRLVRSFIGRARENRAAAEIELMSSTSHEVCELFNGNSIVRAMGAPNIAQFLIFPDEYAAQEDQPAVAEKRPENAQGSGHLDKSYGIHSLLTANEGGKMTCERMLHSHKPPSTRTTLTAENEHSLPQLQLWSATAALEPNKIFCCEGQANG